AAAAVGAQRALRLRELRRRELRARDIFLRLLAAESRAVAEEPADRGAVHLRRVRRGMGARRSGLLRIESPSTGAHARVAASDAVHGVVPGARSRTGDLSVRDAD